MSDMKEFQELLAPVKQWLEAGAPHTTKTMDGTVLQEFGFNMNFINSKFEYDYNMHACGTVACIAGAIDVFNGLGKGSDATDYLEHKFKNLNLHELFYPNEVFAYEAITPKQALEAIKNFEEEGDPMWDDILEEDLDEDW